MIEEILIYLTKTLVGIAFLITIISLYKSAKRSHRLLMLILVVNLENELFSLVFLANAIPTSLLYNISTIFHHCLWIILISSYSEHRILRKSYICFIVPALLNLLFYEQLEFNFYTFIYGSLIYIMIFIYECFNNLKKENLPFFIDNDFLLIIAPVLFFFGFSFMFAFRSIPFVTTFILNDMRLYDFIQGFVNIIYYMLIIIYVIREKSK